MATPQDPVELALVVKAITCGTTGCCEWDNRAAIRLRQQPPSPGMTPERVKELLILHTGDGNAVRSRLVETRPEYADRRFYYKAVIATPTFVKGLFVEIVLDDDDPGRTVGPHRQCARATVVGLP